MSARLCIALMIVLGLGSGCRPTCSNACSKLISTCEAGFPSYNVTVCTADCELIQEEYERYDYLEAEQAAFETQLQCIMDSSCEALLDPENPACYTEDTAGLYVF